MFLPKSALGIKAARKRAAAGRLTRRSAHGGRPAPTEHARAIAPHPRCWPPPRHKRWNPPRCSTPCSPKKRPGGTAPHWTTAAPRAAFPTASLFAVWDPDLSSIPAPTQQALHSLAGVTSFRRWAVHRPVR